MAMHFKQVYQMMTLNNLGTETLEKLGPTIAYLLAAPSTPEPVREQAVAKAESGEKVTVKEVQEWKHHITHTSN